jgi:type II secretory pathway component PulF
MKSKEEMEKWMKDEVTNPMIGALIRNMVEAGLPLDEVMEMIQPIIDNTSNVEEQLVEKAMRIQDGERILSTIKKTK